MPKTSQNPRLRRRGLKALLAVGCLGFGVQGFTQSASFETLTQRQFIYSANTVCGWFDGPTTLALGAGLLQSRNAALNHGVPSAQLYSALDQARHAALTRVDCDKPELRAEVETLKGAYKGFVTQNRLNFPGARSQWHTDRTSMDDQKWRLVQYVQAGDDALGFGLYGTLSGPHLSVMAQFADGARPFSARLIVRDAISQPMGIIHPSAPGLETVAPRGLGHETGVMALRRGEETLALYDAPRVNVAGFTAEGQYKGRNDAKATIRFDFPMAETIAIAKLDPREDIVVAFDFADGTRYARFEAGDFVPGLVFVALPTPYGQGF